MNLRCHCSLYSHNVLYSIYSALAYINVKQLLLTRIPGLNSDDHNALAYVHVKQLLLTRLVGYKD